MPDPGKFAKMASVDSLAQKSSDRGSHLVKKGSTLSNVVKYIRGSLDYPSVFEQFNVKTQEQLEKASHHISNRKWFSVGISLIILLNALCMGLEADLLKGGEGQVSGAVQAVFKVLELFFSCAFFLEMVVRQHHLRWNYFYDPWNALDFCLVLVALLDVSIAYIHRSTQASDLKMLTAIRLVRLLRVVRNFRLLRTFRLLWVIIRALVDAVKVICYAMCILVPATYMCSVLVRGDLAPDLDAMRGEGRWGDQATVYFGSVPRTMFTFFQVLTGDKWSTNVVRPLIRDERYLCTVCVLVFFVLSVYGLLNVVLAVVVERTASVTLDNEDKVQALVQELEAKLLATLQEDFRAAGLNDKGELTWAMFRDLFTSNEKLRL